MSKKGKIALIVISSILLATLIGVSIWLIVTHVESKEYNLIKLNVKGAPTRVETPLEEGYIQLEDINMHYFTIGEGYPIILVHGNGGSYKSLEDLARYLANDYKVYLTESRCHGGSTVTDVINYDLMAKDLQEFVVAMGLTKPIVVGHSDGGINALTMAINYPDLLGGIVSFGANTSPDKFKAFFRIAVKISDAFKPSILNDMMLTEPHITKEQLNSIKIPAYIIAGEYDIMYLEDTVFIANNIANSKLAIIQGADHGNYVHEGRKSYKLVKEFMTSLGL